MRSLHKATQALSLSDSRACALPSHSHKVHYVCLKTSKSASQGLLACPARNYPHCTAAARRARGLPAVSSRALEAEPGQTLHI